MPEKLESFDAQIALGITHLSFTAFELMICIYCGYQLYLNWNELYMQKRRPLLVLLIYIFSCYSILLEYPHFTLLKFFPSVSYWRPPHEIVYIISSLPRFSGLSFLTLRIYLLHFDHEYCKILKQHKWKLLIDPSFLNTNWYFMHKTKSGDHKYMIKHVLIPILSIYYIIYVILYILCRHYLDLTVSICHGITLLLSTICTICNVIFEVKYWKRYPKFLDNLSIRHELSYLIALLMMAFILTFIVAPFSIFSFYSSSANISLIIVLSLLHIGLIYALTIYPKRKYLSYRNFHSGAYKHLNDSMQNIKSWEVFVDTKERYECFANFLEKEFSIENILFITEYVLLKKIMMKNNKLMELLISDADLEYDLALDVSLMDCSLIVKTYQENGLLFDAMYALYKKYIDERTATLAINLSFRVAQNLIYKFKTFEVNDIRDDNMRDDDIKDVIKLYDASAKEISKLMNDSFRRFKFTETFQEVIKHANKKKTETENEMEPTEIKRLASLSIQ